MLPCEVCWTLKVFIYFIFIYFMQVKVPYITMLWAYFSLIKHNSEINFRTRVVGGFLCFSLPCEILKVLCFD